MSNTDTLVEHRKLTGLTIFGIVVTVLYVTLCLYLVFCQIGWAKFSTLESNILGDTLAGFAAPLAFFWLILGFFQQGIELRNQIEETRKLAAEAKNQAASIKGTELHARRELFLKMVELAYRDMSDDLARIIHNAEILGVSEATERWERFGRGDIYTFVHILSDRLIDGEHGGPNPILEAINRSATSLAAVKRYVMRWDQLTIELLSQKTGLDDYFHNSPYGRLSEFFRGTLLQQQ